MVKINNRHAVKSISWRIVATLDTFLLSYFLIGSFAIGLSISGIDFFSKLFIYYMHERLWFKSSIKKVNKRHFLKTFSWRVVGSITTLIIAFVVSGNLLIVFKIGVAETITKMILYYLHEKVWYKISYGLSERNSNYVN